MLAGGTSGMIVEEDGNKSIIIFFVLSPCPYFSSKLSGVAI